METASDRLRYLSDRIRAAAERVGRDPASITLVAVTKTVPLERVLPFLNAGVAHIGENRVQEAYKKYSTPSPFVGEGPGEGSPHLTLHLIGQLQSNKTKKAVALFDVIQSLDRLELADDIDRHARAMGKIMSCLIEVKISPDATKSGLDPDRFDEFLDQLKDRRSLAIKGLMGIASYGADGDAARPAFAKLRRLFEKAKLETLSMGMSHDFEAAIAEGSTMIRLGTALFGPRVTARNGG
jgi:pyridoxal phosphate enzyme (YggS family)